MAFLKNLRHPHFTALCLPWLWTISCHVLLCRAGSDMTQAWPWRCRRDETSSPLCWSCCLGHCSSLFGTRAPSLLCSLLERVQVQLFKTLQCTFRDTEHFSFSRSSQRHTARVFVLLTAWICVFIEGCNAQKTVSVYLHDNSSSVVHNVGPT